MKVKNTRCLRPTPEVYERKEKLFCSITARFIATFPMSLLTQTYACSSHLYHLPLSPRLALTDYVGCGLGKMGLESQRIL